MEETTEEIKAPPKAEKVEKPEKKRKCNHCGTEYTFTRATSKFCSDKCKYAHRNLGSVEQQSASLLPREATVTKNVTSLLSNQPAHIQIAIDLLKDDRDNWKDLYKKSLEEIEKLRQTNSELKDAVNEKENALSGLENQQPTAFQKFMSSIPAEIIQEIAPALGTLFQKGVSALTGGGGAQMAGVNGQLDAQSQGYLQAINAWYCTLPADLQEQVFKAVEALAQAKSPDELKNMLVRIINLLTNETTIQNSTPNFFSPTGT